MRKARWLAGWANSQGKPAIYHCISWVVDRRFVFGDEEREAFAASRERFSENRKSGARRMKGSAKAAAGLLWTARDLRVGI